VRHLQTISILCFFEYVDVNTTIFSYNPKNPSFFHSFSRDQLLKTMKNEMNFKSNEIFKKSCYDRYKKVVLVLS
jgi:hypothetical protein